MSRGWATWGKSVNKRATPFSLDFKSGSETIPYDNGKKDKDFFAIFSPIPMYKLFGKNYHLILILSFTEIELFLDVWSQIVLFKLKKINYYNLSRI